MPRWHLFAKPKRRIEIVTWLFQTTGCEKAWLNREAFQCEEWKLESEKRHNSKQMLFPWKLCHFGGKYQWSEQCQNASTALRSSLNAPAICHAQGRQTAKLQGSWHGAEANNGSHFFLWACTLGVWHCIPMPMAYQLPTGSEMEPPWLPGSWALHDLNDSSKTSGGPGDEDV